MGLAFLGAVGGGVLWYGGETLLGYHEVVRPFLGVFALLVGALSGYGALYGSGRVRGWRSQGVAVLVTMPVLVVSQALVVRLFFVRELETIGITGAAWSLPMSTWWSYVSWSLFSTSPPAFVFWGVALAYAIAIPRGYDTT